MFKGSEWSIVSGELRARNYALNPGCFLTLPGLKLSDERAKHFSKYFAVLQNSRACSSLQKSKAFRKEQMGFQFLKGALGYSEKLNEFPPAIATVAFGDICWN
jgi:hypothetical protein